MDGLHPETRALARRLRLAPHPEGGFFRETWRSPVRVGTLRGERSALTVIDYLLPTGAFSGFHRVHADEVWQHAGGDPIEIHVIGPTGDHEMHRVGGGSVAVPHVVVPAGHWQAARPTGLRHALVTCTVGPGFDFSDFEMAREEDLLMLRPDLTSLIRGLCRPSRTPR